MMTLLEQEIKKYNITAGAGNGFKAINPDSALSSFRARENLIHKFAFAIPNEESFKVFKKHQPLLEVGAGTGYWAYEIANRDIDIIATDICFFNKKYNFSHIWSDEFGRSKLRSAKFIFAKMSAEDAIQKYPNHTLFMCWPCYCEAWSGEALKKYKGNHFILISEGQSGCCGGEELWEEIDKNWLEIETVAIPKFEGIHDFIAVYKRK